MVTDRRLDRYWQLTAVINGWPPFPTYTPAFEWLIAALREAGQPAAGGAAIPPWVTRVQEPDDAAGSSGVSP